MSSLRILIIGAGAIGCFVGGKLASAGHSVTLVGRARTSAALQARGLKLHAADGAVQTVRTVGAAASVREAFPAPYDIVVFAVKSYDTAAALDELVSIGSTLPPNILSLQNGVGNENEIAARFGAQRVVAGTITAPVEVREPGVVQVTKPGFAIGLAEFCESSEAKEANPRASLLTSLSSQFSAAGLPTKVYEDAQAMKWSKLLMNMIGNATSAILAEPPGVTFADPRITNLEIDALREALRVMAAANIRPLNMEKYPLGTLAPLLRFGPRALLRPALHRIVGGARGGKMPSLFLDLEAGKSGSEVGWYNGAVVRLGGDVGIETPVNRLLTETVQQLAAEPQSRSAWRGNYERLTALVREVSGS
ncbi:MAG: ketopantoate reductase family protein [Caldilineaceae bacterium]|nr:ketopantoate reductase family protein [Caldilineaceae bacterium]